uniref:G-protein coupled receptors family 1 profile domain-containing protein n=1 Tax=Plectus sambesii TaxID=2011161 RepID=A0A914VZC7_9BILA
MAMVTDLVDMTNQSAASQELLMDDRSLRTTIGCLYMVLTLLGLVAYSIILLAMLRNRHVFSGHPFYALVYHLAIADVSYLVVVFLLPIPYTFARDNFYPSWVSIALASVDTTVMNAVFYMAFLITLNRFLCFLLPNVNRLLFSANTPVFKALLAFPWVIAVAVTVLTTAEGCYKLFDEQMMSYRYKCSGDDLNTSGILSSTFSILAVVGRVIPISMVVMYCTLFLHLKWLQHRSSLPKSPKFSREVRMMLQGVIICAVLLAEAEAFWLLPKVFADSRVPPIIIMVLSIINCSINPFVYFVCNSAVRGCVAEEMRCLVGHWQTVQPIPTTNTVSTSLAVLTMSDSER